jgi:hypothetical protein
LEFLAAFAMCPASAQDDGFCVTLKQIISDKPNDFKAVRSKKPVPHPAGAMYMPNQFLPLITLPGIDKCEVDGSRTDYVCANFYPTAEFAWHFETLRDQVGSCLGSSGTKSTQGTDDEFVDQLNWEGPFNSTIGISVNRKKDPNKENSSKTKSIIFGIH